MAPVKGTGSAGMQGGGLLELLRVSMHVSAICENCCATCIILEVNWKRGSAVDLEFSRPSYLRLLDLVVV